MRTFRFVVEDVFSPSADGAILLGVIEQGTITVGDAVLISVGREEVRADVTGIEVFRAVLTTASEGQEIGLRVKGVDPSLLATGTIVKSAKSN